MEKYHEAKQTGDTAAMAIHAEAMKADFDYFGYGYLNSPEEAIPNIPLTFYTFHAMVILGGYLLIFLIASLLLAYKRGIMEKTVDRISEMTSGAVMRIVGKSLRNALKNQAMF